MIRLAKAAALGLLLILPARAFAQAQPQPVVEKELSVLTYNVAGLPWPVRKDRGEALKAIGRELAKMRAEGRAPDVVLVQEAFRDEIHDLIRLSGYPHHARGPKRKQRDPALLDKPAQYKRGKYWRKGEGLGKWRSSGLYILSNYPIETRRSHAFRYCAGFDCLANKGVQLAGIRLPGAPTVIDVANTHMNARKASRVPRLRAFRAHNLQADELKRFVAVAHDPTAPLVVGGDFNIRKAPDRYNYMFEDYDFDVASEYCWRSLAAGACAIKVSMDGDAPWLDTQDLIGSTAGTGASIWPIEIEALFDGQNEPVLSDHDGLMVRFRVRWPKYEPPVVALPQSSVEPAPGKAGMFQPNSSAPERMDSAAAKPAPPAHQ
ncbi:endonuclease/exonuclease/phosphatase family protein [Caulobacter segnis]|uniref:endonuclease/exonuclease/phosphatase family protein n=1 Tax=Caulobacter segnis TaxID=88688 RepID=UPI00240EFAEA|nr:endonuclease/exonuclease/phosphatase family protein [Caulobacter segnis]MDG2520075.1 endonuclease/exonuclease/phosphatase family protein [Caulobacter segnis]